MISMIPAKLTFLISNIVICLLLTVISTVGITRQLQMLQLNSYFASRYFGWLKQNKKYIAANIFFILLSALAAAFLRLRDWSLDLLFKFIEPKLSYALIFLIAGAALLVVLAVAAYIFAARAVSKNRKSIKPLVVTARIKRTYATSAIVSLVLSAVCVLFEGFPGFAAFFLLCLLTFAPCLNVLLCLFLNAPIEKAIANHYVRDAKKILKANKNLTVLGITGSFGKTSTKFIVKRILDEAFNVVATPGSFNTPMGVVRTVRGDLSPVSDIFLCEMGAKKRGDIKEICDIAKPQIAIITSVGPQHLDTFGSIEAVADTKFELADAADEVFLNFDNEIIRSRAEKYNYTSYGTTEDCDVYAKDISYGSFGAAFTVVCDGEELHIVTKLLGRHNVLNITAGVAVAKRLGIKDSAIEYAASRLTPTEHRLEMKSFINGSLLIDDAYNANPEGCLEAVNVLSSFQNKKKIIVTPGLVELGADEYKYNYQLGLAAAKKCDIIILVGEERAVPMLDAAKAHSFPEENLHVVRSFAEAMAILNTVADKDCVTLFENDLPDNYLR